MKPAALALPPGTEPATEPVQPDRVRHLRQRVADRAAERDLALQLAEIETDTVFDELRSEAEAAADRKVAEAIRKAARVERRKAGRAQVQRAKRNRRWAWWDERAERARDRILDPARAIGADYRKLTASSAAAGVLIAGGVAYMSVNVHDGLVGPDGSWTAYLVEPLASVLLAISMVAQLTARKRGIAVPRGFYAFDAALAGASVLLNVVPSGLRFGWQATDLVGHVLVPALVVAAVVAWHLASNLYGTAIAQSMDDPVTREQLLRGGAHPAHASRSLDPTPVFPQFRGPEVREPQSPELGLASVLSLRTGPRREDQGQDREDQYQDRDDRGQDREDRTGGPDVSDLLDDGRAVADDLHNAGGRLTRATLADGLRARGCAFSTDRVTALLAVLRMERTGPGSDDPSPGGTRRPAANGALVQR